MSDAWIYSEDREFAAELSAALAELGSARGGSGQRSLLPSGETARAPAAGAVV